MPFGPISTEARWRVENDPSAVNCDITPPCRRITDDDAADAAGLLGG
ncbi:MAG: hypothetical protein R2706_03690 [Acidimicrobiales bacterium]